MPVVEKPPVADKPAVPRTPRDSLREARRLRRQDPDAALKMIATALAAKPGDGGALLLKAQILLDQDRTKDALNAADEALASDKSNADAWRMRGKILIDREPEQARKALVRYLELRPDAPDADTIRSAIDSL